MDKIIEVLLVLIFPFTNINLNINLVRSNSINLAKGIVGVTNSYTFIDKESTKIEQVPESENAQLQESKIDTTEVQNVVYNGICIQNHTSYEIDLKEIVDEVVNQKWQGDEINVLVYHTHTTESYKQEIIGEYSDLSEFRTLNENYNIVSVGEKLLDELKPLNVCAIQSTAVNDYPEYDGAYDRSLNTANWLVDQYGDTGTILLDLHRDAVDKNADEFRLVYNDNGLEVAQLMIVVGTDAGGLNHDNWRQNLKLAVKLQMVANELYPGLFRNIDLRIERFNQNVSDKALLIEVGGTGNTVTEAQNSMKYLANIIQKLGE